MELNNTKRTSDGQTSVNGTPQSGLRDVAAAGNDLPARIKRADGFVGEFEGMGPGYQVIIKSPDERWNEQMPSIDSEYRMGYDMTKELIRDEKGIKQPS